MKTKAILRASLPILAAWLFLTVVYALVIHLAQGLGGGALIASNGDPVGFLDSLYFCIVTATTVGYGDITPIGWFRGLASADAVTGIVMAGALVASLTSELLDPLIAVRELEGIWFKGGMVDAGCKQPDLKPFTVFRIYKNGREWTCEGANYDASAEYKHAFTGRVLTMDKKTLYVAYQNDAASARDYTAGLWILHLDSDIDGIVTYRGYSFDHLYGRRDASHGIRLDEERHSDITRGLRARQSTDSFHMAFTKARNLLERPSAQPSKPA